jgi:DHA2 family multidrug resistance protein
MKNISKMDTPDASTLTNVMRNLGGAFSIAIIATLLDNKTREHLAHIKESLPSVSQLGWQTLKNQQAFFIQSGSDAATEMQQAQASLLGTMQRDAAIMAYNDVFLMMTAFLALAAVLILNMRD